MTRCIIIEKSIDINYLLTYSPSSSVDLFYYFFVAYLNVLYQFHTTTSFLIVCSQALGLADKTKILDSQISTPDGAVVSGKEGKYARLNNNEAWCIPQLKTSEDIFRDNIHVDINLGQIKMITAIAVQGLNQYSPGKKIRLLYDIGAGDFLDHSPDVNIFLCCIFQPLDCFSRESYW